MLPPAADMAPTVSAPALALVGGDAEQGGGLAAADGAQFGLKWLRNGGQLRLRQM